MTTNPWTVRTQLAARFGLLAALVLLVSMLAVRALDDGHTDYATYVNDTSARSSIANHVLDATNARAVAARNLLLVNTAADRQTETAAVQAAHARVTEQLGKLRQAVTTGGIVSDRERTLFAAIEDVEARYGPVALAIVQMALADQRDAAIEKMNAEYRPLLAALLQAADAYVAYQESAAAAEVLDAEAAYTTNRNLMLAASALAVAAREIKRLIGASVDKVEIGTRLVADAGSSMTDIVAQVQRVAGLLTEIDAATLEQTSGIGQVSDAVTQLDQVTQQNAALVEESAAAADSLKQQAARLADLVSVFRVAVA